MARVPPHKPVIAIIGATGTGKSQLAVEVARRFNGEIINSDAMQLYQGLPVITNKITEEEKKGVPHHLLGSIGIEEDTWTVGEFVKKALGVIDEIRARGRLPVLVGGTHYYIQSLLFEDTLADAAEDSSADAVPQSNTPQQFPILEEPTEVILTKLREVDPVMADRWHPKDRRKIQRSLEIYLKTGKPASQTYEEQSLRKQVPSTHSQDPNNNDPTLNGMRFPALLLWVHAAPEPLRMRLDARVDKMLAAGLLDEVHELDTFLQQQTANGKAVDRTRGIWVSIGYKEFEAYQRALTSSSSDDTAPATAAELQKLKAQAVEQVQAGTRQYAKRQVRWIRIKLLHALATARATRSLYLLDGSDLARWEATVQEPGLDLARQFLAGEPLPDPAELSDAAREMLTPKREYDVSARRDLWQRRVCETCGTVAVTQDAWEKHIKSRGHRIREKKTKQRTEGAVASPRKKVKEEEQREELGESKEVDTDVQESLAAFDELTKGER